MSSKRSSGTWPLFAGWIGYWGVLAAATLSKPIAMAWNLSRQPPGTASASANVGNGSVDLTLTSQGAAIWSGSSTVISLVLLIAGPPLIMWLVWLITRSRATAANAAHDAWNTQAAATQSQRAADHSRANAPSTAAHVPELQQGVHYNADILVKPKERAPVRDSEAEPL